MRLFPIKMSTSLADLRDNPQFEFKQWVQDHRPSLHVRGQLGKELIVKWNVPPAAELFRHADSGSYFTRLPLPDDAGVVIISIHSVRLFDSEEPDEDEFPNEVDSRPKYHLPKWWTYGTCVLEIASTNRDFPVYHGELLLKVREKRIL